LKQGFHIALLSLIILFGLFALAFLIQQGSYFGIGASGLLLFLTGWRLWDTAFHWEELPEHRKPENPVSEDVLLSITMRVHDGAMDRLVSADRDKFEAFQKSADQAFEDIKEAMNHFAQNGLQMVSTHSKSEKVTEIFVQIPDQSL